MILFSRRDYCLLNHRDSYHVQPPTLIDAATRPVSRPLRIRGVAPRIPLIAQSAGANSWAEILATTFGDIFPRRTTGQRYG
jgi:hypothetical protein